MKSTWNNGMGSRGRLPLALLVTGEGKIIKFDGVSIEGVCSAVVLKHEKNGRWSNTDYEILHHKTTSFVAWRQQYVYPGYSWKQKSWEDGKKWLEKMTGKSIDEHEFLEFIEREFEKTATRWDEYRRAEKEFE